MEVIPKFLSPIFLLGIPPPDFKILWSTNRGWLFFFGFLLLNLWLGILVIRCLGPEDINLLFRLFEELVSFFDIFGILRLILLWFKIFLRFILDFWFKEIKPFSEDFELILTNSCTFFRLNLEIPDLRLTFTSFLISFTLSDEIHP